MKDAGCMVNYEVIVIIRDFSQFIAYYLRSLYGQVHRETLILTEIFGKPAPTVLYF